jgi:hypothetical protein
VAFHQLLVGARKTWLIDALRDALATVDVSRLRAEIALYTPPDVQTTLASVGIRDEWVFPTPVVLEARPTLIGYYRLLLGVSQKAFYRGGTGMGRFKSMETSGTMKEKQRALLPEFCEAMGEGLADLIRQLSPQVTPRDVNELPLLTLGSQFQGGSNVAIGKQATVDVFLAIADIVTDYIAVRAERQLTVINASGRRVLITLAGDPDVRIQEDFSGTLRNKVALEIKGGTDMSNVHNRAGEAEKSHQKAKAEGFRDFWTIILKKGLSIDKLRSESPTTNSWFDAAQVLGREGTDWEEFRTRVAGEVGIPSA